MPRVDLRAGFFVGGGEVGTDGERPGPTFGRAKRSTGRPGFIDLAHITTFGRAKRSTGRADFFDLAHKTTFGRAVRATGRADFLD